MEKVSLIINEMGEFVDRDSDADAELHRRRAYAKLRSAKPSRQQPDPKSVLAGKMAHAGCKADGNWRVKATCPWCGEEFEKRRSNQRFCTKYCQKKFSYERKKAR